ncbi:hypothetical protein FRZ44_28860 [Hypericibacter terrae]|uniref:Uncharacterized protein n=1 Tax=Hypericibacter terrae TaxID=2602015 RepID=A0A5J6MJF4_9PROT|nr:hypothetical protein FRZ44_28860 [Hypericibacter terrae]
MPSPAISINAARLRASDGCARRIRKADTSNSDFNATSPRLGRAIITLTPSFPRIKKSDRPCSAAQGTGWGPSR